MLTSRQLAETLGISMRRVAQLASDGVLERVRGRFDLGKSVRAYCAALRRGGRDELEGARTRLAKAHATRIEYENATAAHTLADIRDIAVAHAQIYARVVQRLYMLPDRACSRIDPAVAPAVRKAIRDTLDEIILGLRRESEEHAGRHHFPPGVHPPRVRAPKTNSEEQSGDDFAQS